MVLLSLPLGVQVHPWDGSLHDPKQGASSYWVMLLFSHPVKEKENLSPRYEIKVLSFQLSGKDRWYVCSWSSNIHQGEPLTDLG